MTSHRGLTIPFVLVALVMLLPNAVGAQGNCCDCNANGTSCSACCWEDQAPLCRTYPNPTHCGCYCDTDAGGGGGCGGMMLSSRTLVISSDRGPELADHQLRFGLQNSGDRREGSFVFEEWALVSSEGGKATVVSASTSKFWNRVQGVAERFRPSGDTSTILVIEDAVHPHNSREIPVPEVAPIDFDAELPVNVAGQEVWFRAEVGEDGVVDQVVLFHIPEAFPTYSINERLRERLSLRYADAGRHRAVVFGAVRADENGRLAMTESLVVLPTCCCGGVHCV